MVEMQLYIQNQRVDTFKDESVTLTDSIQNVRDFEKIFTSFSQSFNLPASKTNNKIFKHYYNFNIQANYAFDARVKTLANIELNSMPFRRGYIKLEGVDLKDNVPYSYRITFFGEIVKLKDAIGEKKLSDLQGLGSVVYNSNNIRNYMQRTPTQNDVVVPLITHTQRLYYNSNASVFNSGNLHYGAQFDGVKWNELKPAMRLNRIIEGIEETFPQLEFTDDFFKNENNPKFHNLFMWLSRKSGAVENLSGSSEVLTFIDDFPVGGSQNYVFVSSGGYIGIDYYYHRQYLTVYRYTLTYNSGGSYKATVRDTFGQILYESPEVTGNLTINLSDLSLSNTQFLATTLYITASQPVTFTNIRFRGEYYEYDPYGSIVDSYNISTGSVTTDADFVFDYNLQMPDITVLNFLSGLFRMFNLTAFVQDDGKIKVQPLDEYYEDNPVYRDITQYVGTEKSSVDAALPYRQVKFEFADTKSFLANKFGEIENKAWGLLQYNNNQNDLTGSLYKVTAPFGHFLYERLNDASNNQQLNLQWGWSVDKSQNAQLPQPLLFYPIFADDTPQISVVDEVNQDNEPVSHTTLRPKSMPFNHYATNPANGNFQLNYTQEISEWTGQNNFTETLFSAYRKYILSIFNPKQRITTLEVMLPLAVLLKIEMKDRLIIAGNNYKINKLTTNLQTGKSQLELINDYTIEA